jgi:Zn-dependent peptidase ImmA (M78 family)
MHLDEETAARKVGVVVGTLRKWEAGETAPSIRQLRRLAAAYKRPLAVLFLPGPPKDFSVLKDFRAGPEREAGVQSPELEAEYRRAMTQREVILEIAELGGAAPDSPEPPGIALDDAADRAATVLRVWLGIPARWDRPARALAGWIEAIEARGILVVQTKRVPTTEMSGFSVSAWPHPVIAVNGGDFPKRRLFTLAHEMAHLALNAGGLCDLHEERDATELEDQIELFCNRVAAAALMPAEALAEIREFALARADKAWTTDQLEAIAAPFGTSGEAMLLRLIALNKSTWERYWELKPTFDEGYAAARAAQRDAEGGPSFYVVQARNLGPGYVRTVLDAFRGRVITSLDAADYLDVRYEQIPRLEQAL